MGRERKVQWAIRDGETGEYDIKPGESREGCRVRKLDGDVVVRVEIREVRRKT